MHTSSALMLPLSCDLIIVYIRRLAPAGKGRLESPLRSRLKISYYSFYTIDIPILIAAPPIYKSSNQPRVTG